MSAHPGATGTLHRLFEERVRLAPEAIALEYEGETLSYDTLNRRANRLAHHLREACGVRPDDRVALVLRHPPSVVVAMLAALKAGAAYVPLDPDNPPAVTVRIVEKLEPRVTVIESATAAGAAFYGGELFVTDVMSEGLATPETDPEPAAGPEHLAYVIHTSGTTGAPKGIAVEHRAILETIRWRNAFYGFGPGDVTLAIPRPSFDSSVVDTFCALTSGARLLLPARDRITDRNHLADLMRQHAVTHFLITPALYQRLLGGMTPEATGTLRSVTLAGEWFTTALTRAHFARVPRVRLFNEYGPSENAVCSTVHELAADDTHVLIGRPIPHTEAYVLAENGEPAAPGETGELYLAGRGLARGYLNDPELTAQRFAPLATGPLRGVRTYRTGDIVRQHKGGDLEFVERRDQQVKIRGRRVELGSVAEVLGRHDAVRHVVLLCRDSAAGAPRLIAFVAGPKADQTEQLHALAAAELPDYMVPSVFVPIESVPVTGNGKVDEAALDARYAEWAGDAADGGPAPDAPRPATRVESGLLEIWQKIFAPLRVGLDDDFFELGGDSLTVMDLTASVDAWFGVQLDNSDAYTGRTVRTLAPLVETLLNSKAEIA